MRMVIVSTHPIQHFCPQYASIAARSDVELLVVFDSLKGVEPYEDEGFGQTVSWGTEILDGFDYRVRRGAKLKDVIDFEPDVLVVYGYTSDIAKAAFAYALTHPKVKLGYISDSEFRRGNPPTLGSRVGALVRRILFPRVKYFLTVGDANEEYYAAHRVPESKMIRMHFPISPPESISEERKEELRQKHQIPGDALVVLNVGKFDMTKRQRDLVDSLGDVPGVHLIFAGSGDQFEAVQEQAAGLSNVTFLGFMHPEELWNYYSISDVYAHPSEYDHHPLSVSEAIAVGSVPVVSSRTGVWGATDDVIPGVTGFVFEPGDNTRFRGIIEDLRDDRELLKKLAAAGREKSVEYQALAHGGFVDAMIDIH